MSTMTETREARKTLNVTDAAAMAGVTETDIIAALEAGDIRGRKVRGQWAVESSAVTPWQRAKVAASRLFAPAPDAAPLCGRKWCTIKHTSPDRARQHGCEHVFRSGAAGLRLSLYPFGRDESDAVEPDASVIVRLEAKYDIFYLSPAELRELAESLLLVADSAERAPTRFGA